MSDFEMLDDNRLKSFPYQGLNNYPQQAKNVRDKFKDYLISPEALIFQNQIKNNVYTYVAQKYTSEAL